MAFGISLNNLSLFGLVLAVGIVVDDAIVVVENVERNMRDGMSPLQAAHRTMDEVGGALISIALTLCAVFVPSAFLSGISGLFFRQFAVTIAASTVISCFVSLTLSPALCAVLFKAHYDARSLTRRLGTTAAIAGFQSLQSRLRPAVFRLRKLDASTGARNHHRARGLCGADRRCRRRVLARRRPASSPSRTRATSSTVVQLPAGATLDRTEKVVRRGIDIILGTKGVEHVAPFAGLDATTFTVASNAGNDLLRLAVALQSRASGRDREHGARRPA